MLYVFLTSIYRVMSNKTKEPQGKKIIIAIDGHSSCGKSTLARDLAAATGYLFIDTGAMYRAITLKILTNGIRLDDSERIRQVLEETELEFRQTETGMHLFMDKKDVENGIRTPEVAALVSPVARISQVRKKLVEKQQSMGRNKGVVMEGRDITTVVFPEAELKVFVTADVTVRAMRRFLELSEKGLKISLEEVTENIRTRDRIDSTRADSPLRQAPDALVLDTTHHTRQSQLEQVLEWFYGKINTCDAI